MEIFHQRQRPGEGQPADALLRAASGRGSNGCCQH